VKQIANLSSAVPRADQTVRSTTYPENSQPVAHRKHRLEAPETLISCSVMVKAPGDPRKAPGVQTGTRLQSSIRHYEPATLLFLRYLMDSISEAAAEHPCQVRLYIKYCKARHRQEFLSALFNKGPTNNVLLTVPPRNTRY